MVTRFRYWLKSPMDRGAWRATVLLLLSFNPMDRSTPHLPVFTISRNLLKLMCVDFPHSSVGRESACDAGDPGLIPGSGRSSGEGNGNPLQYSCLENPMDRGVWQATVHGIAKSQTQLSD